ncbi:MAG: hypothetical protein AB1468_00835 [Candidatus Micrarchaeota archaeon]
MAEERGAVAEGKKPIVAEFKAELARELKTHVVEDAGIMTSVKEPPRSLKHLHLSKEPSVANQILSDTLATHKKIDESADIKRTNDRMTEIIGAALHRGAKLEVENVVREAMSKSKDYLDRIPEDKLTLKDIELREKGKKLKDEKEMLVFLKEFAAVHPYALADIFSRVAPELYQESLREVRAQRMREEMLVAIRMNELARSNVMELAMFSVSSVMKKSEEEKEESTSIAEMKAREEKEEREIERMSSELVRVIADAIEEQIKNLKIALSENAKSMLAAEVLMLVAHDPKNYVNEGEIKKNVLVASVHERVSTILGAA